MKNRSAGRRVLGRLVVLVAVLVVVALAVPAVVAVRVWQVSRQDDRSQADVILVLGAAQFNGVPSPVLESRLLHAEALFDDGVAPLIMTVGGKQPGDNFTEAEAGRRFLRREDVPASAIVAVGEGGDTLESLRAAAAAMKERGLSSAVLVTDPDHSLRARTMARDLGMSAHTSPARFNSSRASSENGRRYIVRETGAYLDYLIFRRAGVEPVL